MTRAARAVAVLASLLLLVTSGCVRSEELVLPDPPDARSVIVVLMRGDAVEVRAAALPLRVGLTFDADTDVAALYYPCPLAALRLEPGDVPLTDVGGRALPPTPSWFRRAPGAASWSPGGAALSPELSALHLDLPEETGCATLEVTRTLVLGPSVTVHLGYEQVLAAVTLDDGSVLFTTDDHRGFRAAPDAEELQLIPSLITQQAFIRAFRRVGDDHLWLLGPSLELAELRGDPDVGYTQTSLSEAHTTAWGKGWFGGSASGPLHLWGLGSDGTAVHFDEALTATTYPCPECGMKLDATGGVAVAPNGEAFVARRTLAFRSHGDELERVGLELPILAELSCAAYVDAPAFGPLFGAGGGSLFRPQGDIWVQFAHTSGLPVRAIAPLDDGLLFGGEGGELREYRADGTLCGPLMPAPGSIEYVLPLPTGFALLGNIEHGPGFVIFARVRRLPAACPLDP